MAIQLLTYYQKYSRSADARSSAAIASANIGPVADGVVARAESAGYYVPRGFRVIGAYAAASGTYTTSTLTATAFDPLVDAQLYTPSLLRVGPAAILPRRACRTRQAPEPPRPRVNRRCSGSLATAWRCRKTRFSR